MTDDPIPVPPLPLEERLQLAAAERFPDHTFEAYEHDDVVELFICLNVVADEAATGELSVSDARGVDPDVVPDDELLFLLAKVEGGELGASDTLPVGYATLGLDEAELQRFIAEFVVEA